MNNKEEYEKLIDASLLFSLDRDKERTKYKREALKMIEYLYAYLMAVNAYKYEAYAVEIVETAKRCIENYDPSSGRFLNYFVSAWKNVYRHHVGTELVNESFKGMHFAEGKERLLKKYMRFLQVSRKDIQSNDFDERIIEIMGITAEEAEILRKMISCKPTTSSYISVDGEEYSVWDVIDSGTYTDSHIIQFEEVKALIDQLDSVFSELQERQKHMLSVIITSKIAHWAYEDLQIRAIVSEKSFFNNEIFEEVIKRGEPIQSKEIAVRFGVTEASISRTWKTFKEKLDFMNQLN